MAEVVCPQLSGARARVLSNALIPLFRSGSGFTFLSLTADHLPICMMQLILVSPGLFGSCCWRRRLSGCKSCSEGSQVWPLS